MAIPIDRRGSWLDNVDPRQRLANLARHQQIPFVGISGYLYVARVVDDNLFTGVEEERLGGAILGFLDILDNPNRIWGHEPFRAVHRRRTGGQDQHDTKNSSSLQKPRLVAPSMRMPSSARGSTADAHRQRVNARVLRKRLGGLGQFPL